MLVFSFHHLDFKFSMYPPSMIAAASIGIAVLGLRGSQVLHTLHEITGVEVVS